MNFRVGIGYDVHRLEPDLPLKIGGVTIPHDKGASGHSDADVLIHAICDALLGAAALGDIGTHFPDKNPEYKGIDSSVLLKRTHDLLLEKTYKIVNIDSVVILQKPKINPFIQKMRIKLASVLEMNQDDISVKATTSEKLGFTGREEGVAAEAVALIIKMEVS